MSQYTIKKYEPQFYSIWNQFIADSKNGTFLFHRDFMEYHSDRFEDFSLLVFDDKDNLVAVLPANRVDDTIYSHQGLTYGGVVFSNKLEIFHVEQIMNSIVFFFKIEKIHEIILKNQPTLYLIAGNYGLDYVLFQYFNSELLKREMNFMIDYSKKMIISKSKLKHFKRISKLGLKVVEESNMSFFWDKVLIPCLESKHNVKPVHSLEEIQKLKSKFPSNIIQYSVYLNEEILAGITLFKNKNGVKSQYGASTEIGQKYRALDYLFITLIQKFNNQEFAFFDMGTATEKNELGYNPGLVKQKIELGCAIFNQDTIQIKL
ncbi:FemAB family protein [Flavobacterium sp. H122]|uniref:FemAB family protein n=1 Tax=Flavobacterium sp. H122 TaxID=2529860 RepID=UPI0010AB2660|nr:FemAB family protein [Flavobacterium sp. H122]